MWWSVRQIREQEHLWPRDTVIKSTDRKKQLWSAEVSCQLRPAEKRGGKEEHVLLREGPMRRPEVDTHHMGR